MVAQHRIFNRKLSRLLMYNSEKIFKACRNFRQAFFLLLPTLKKKINNSPEWEKIKINNTKRYEHNQQPKKFKP